MWESRLLYCLSLLGAILLVRYDQRLGFTAVYALLLLLALSLAAVIAAPMLIKIEEDTDGVELFKGDTLHYRATIRNRGLFYYPRVALVRHSAGLLDYGPDTVSILPRGVHSDSCDAVLRWRGDLAVGIAKVLVSDFFGLFAVSFTVEHPLQLTVLPRPDEDFAVFIRNDSQYATWRTELGNESTADVADVRKHTPADSLRHVHWKLSAKRSELMVKNYHSFDPNETYIFLDTRAVPGEDDEARAFLEDKMVSFATAGADYCTEGRIPAWLIYGSEAEDFAPIDAEADPDNLYRLLARIRFAHPASPFPDFARGFAHRAGGFNLLLLLSCIDAAVFDALRRLQSWDSALFVYYFAAGEVDAEQDYYLESLRVFGILVNRVTVAPPVPAGDESEAPESPDEPEGKTRRGRKRGAGQ